ncbi:hydrogenase [Achromobacter sp. ESBL13]|uniref:hydrogenase n=1 Tax=Achromobacter sp. ESBL13 TaxID=3077328 RepID=UPI002FC858F8
MLTYQPARPGAAPRLVDIGSAVSALPSSDAHGHYQVMHLAPSMRLLAWHGDGARFDMSCHGSIQVWAGPRLAASECPHECRQPGVLPLAPEDVAYLEAYLLVLGQAWHRADTNADTNDDTNAARLPQ